ncbi:MAG: tetratricopeptide repeat protein, partial [Erysipelotrichia bacterium]|nr:tetratricopeptide repeat protein [Erysipelotrichia bacterium]
YAAGNAEKSFTYFKQAAILAEDLKQEKTINNLFINLVYVLPYKEHEEILFRGMEFCEEKQLPRCIVMGKIALGKCYARINEYAKADSMYTEALQLAEKQGFAFSHASVLQRLGQLYYLKSNYISALSYFFESHNVFQSNGFDVETANINYLTGLVEMNLGNYTVAVEHILKALNYYESVNRIPDRWNCNEILGNIYIKVGDYSKALSYHRMALSLRTTAKMRLEALGHRPAPETYLGFAYSYNNLAEVFLRINMLDSAFYYAQKSLKIKLSDHSNASLNDIANSYLNLGNIYRAKGVSDSACILIKLATDTYAKIGNKSSQAEALYGLGNLFTDQKDFKNAIKLFGEGLNLSLAVNDKNNAMTGYHQLYETYDLITDHKNALLNFTLYTQYKDSIFDKEKTSMIEELQLRYNLEKKQNEIISRDNKIKKQESSFFIHLS